MTSPPMQMTIDGREESVAVSRGEAVPPGMCGCGCGCPTSNLYVNKTHAQRAYRRRVQRAMEAVGLPASPSLAVARSMGTMLVGNGDPEIDRKRSQRANRSGVQISYRKAVAAVAKLLAHLDPDVVGASPMFCEHVAEAALLDALPARQRERLEARERS